jgi:hypothetical protein
MPELKDEVKDLYIKAHGQDVYDLYCDREGSYHGERLTTKPETAQFLHHPWHDIKSVFWTLLHVLMHACPKGSDPNRDNESFVATMVALESHTMVLPA